MGRKRDIYAFLLMPCRRCVPDQCVPDQCVPERKFLADASLTDVFRPRNQVEENHIYLGYPGCAIHILPQA